uniref:Plasmid pRiA4b ORF-3 family protein n=1 Tax=Janibacter limosus TaxID=53458 RepID=A0AC61U5I7_9MICO|nr:plasmid pRiA4b ORF-3 family protein [Janibacter limosus]
MGDLLEEPRPEMLAVPDITRGFRVRLDLRGTKPPVWRRLELPGDLTLPGLHEVIRAAMGWTDSHLHRFRTGVDRRSPYFVTGFDLTEGEDGVLEDDVRPDQLVAAKGDRLGYEYDFGDDWDHVLTVEEVPDAPPSRPRCTGGRLACPPEDCGGIGGHDQLAQWVRSGHDDALLPPVFEDSTQAHMWLPPDWHPDAFDLNEADDALAIVSAGPAAVTERLGAMVERLHQQGDPSLRLLLSRPAAHEPVGISDEDAARLTETYRIFLETIGEGVKLTRAGYLPPAMVETLAEHWRGRVVDRGRRTGKISRGRCIRCAPRLAPWVWSPCARAGWPRPWPARVRATTAARSGSTSSRGCRSAPRTSTTTPGGSPRQWSAVACRPRAGRARSATCSPASGGAPITPCTGCLPPTARHSSSRSSSPGQRGPVTV